jgi:hypothetical protein
VQLVWSEIGRSGSERVLVLFGAGVEALVLAGEVEAPVFLESTIAFGCSSPEGTSYQQVCRMTG